MAPRRLLVAAGVAGVLLLFLQLHSSDTARERLHHELRQLRHQLQDAEEHLRVTERQLRAAEARPSPKCPACEHERSVESATGSRSMDPNADMSADDLLALHGKWDWVSIVRDMVQPFSLVEERMLDTAVKTCAENGTMYCMRAQARASRAARLGTLLSRSASAVLPRRYTRATSTSPITVPCSSTVTTHRRVSCRSSTSCADIRRSLSLAGTLHPRPPSLISPVCRRCLTWTSSSRPSTSRASKPRRAPRTGRCRLGGRGSTEGGGGAVWTAAHLRWRTCAGAPPRVGEARQAVPQPQQAAPSALLVDHQPRAPRPAMARLLVLHA